MTSTPITCLLFSDLSPWEREGIQALLHYLHLEHAAKVEELEIEQKNVFKGTSARGTFWIFAHRWESALASLRLPVGSRIIVSALSSSAPASFLPALFLNRFRREFAKVSFVAHSPLSFRFLCEIRGISQTQVSFLPLPVQARGVKLTSRPDRITVGVIARYFTDANLHYLLNVAHYVFQKKSQLHFFLLGTGPLEKHLRNIISELGIQSAVTLAKPDLATLDEVDLVIFSPLQNHHFIPIQLAASRAIAVIANEMPGIEQYLQDGKTGFVVNVNETKPMAELALRLAQDQQLRKSLGDKLQSHILSTFSMSALARNYEAVLKGDALSPKIVSLDRVSTDSDTNFSERNRSAGK